MGMHITITDRAGFFVFVIPIVPENIDITTENDNTDFQTTRRFLRIFGNRKNRRVSWSSFFPVNKPDIMVEPNSEQDGNVINNFIRNRQNIDEPIRIVITNDNRRPVLNMLATIDKYSFREDKTRDIQYSIELTEFVF